MQPPDDDKPCLYTIGHSDLSFEQFIALLRRHKTAAIADVRSMPYIQRLPQFNREGLASGLQRAGIRYVFLGEELGARRSEEDCYVDGQARYDRIATMPLFQQGL